MKICIVGAGKLGLNIASALFDSGNEITIIEKDPLRAQSANNSLDVFVSQSDGLVIENLKNIGIDRYDLLIACTEEDEKNITICAFAKKLGCNQTIARVRSPEHVGQLGFIKESMGIDMLLNPNYVCADEVYKYLTQQYAIEGGLFTHDGLSILEFEASKMPALIDKEVKDTSSILNGILLGAIAREGKIIIPHGDTQIRRDDTLYIAGQTNQVVGLSRNEGIKEKIPAIKRVMIAGGGRTGYFLAKRLSAAGIAVKIIEIDSKRCKELASSLDNTVVINADASDINILLDENLEAMDAFVAATGFDEENLLISMLVKQHNVEEVVAIVTRGTYGPITDKLGTSAIINPQEIITSEVLSFARKKGVVLFSKVINGQAEFREIQVESSMPITRSRLADLNIPKDILVLAVHRGRNIIIPNGATQLSAGDRVLFLSLLSASGELESFISNSTKSVL